MASHGLIMSKLKDKIMSNMVRLANLVNFISSYRRLLKDPCGRLRTDASWGGSFLELHTWTSTLEYVK